jgi:hypothetical protein
MCPSTTALRASCGPNTTVTATVVNRHAIRMVRVIVMKEASSSAATAAAAAAAAVASPTTAAAAVSVHLHHQGTLPQLSCAPRLLKGITRIGKVENEIR